MAPYAFAIAATLCLAAANVAWAWSLDDGVYRYVMITVSVAADIGAPCALMAMMHYHGDKEPASALGAFVVWAFCVTPRSRAQRFGCKPTPSSLRPLRQGHRGAEGRQRRLRPRRPTSPKSAS